MCGRLPFSTEYNSEVPAPQGADSPPSLLWAESSFSPSMTFVGSCFVLVAIFIEIIALFIFVPITARAGLIVLIFIVIFVFLFKFVFDLFVLFDFIVFPSF